MLASSPLLLATLLLTSNLGGAQAQFVQPYLPLSQQPVAAGLRQGPPQASQFLQRQSQQLQQLPPLDAGDATTHAAEQREMQHATASLPMQDVMSLMDTMQALQQRRSGLEKELAGAHAQEKRLHDGVLTATYRSNAIDQSARKLAQLAQTSAAQAQQSMDQEQAVLNSMQKRLTDAEREKRTLATQVSQTKRAVTNLQDVVARTQRKEQEAVRARQLAERKARESEAREMKALHAVKQEDEFLKSQEVLIRRMEAEEEARASRLIDELKEGAPQASLQRPSLPRRPALRREGAGAAAQFPHGPGLRTLSSRAAFDRGDGVSWPIDHD